MCLSLFRLDIHVFVLVVHKIYIYHSCSLCSKGSIVCSVCLCVCVYVYTFRLESVVSLAALYKSPSDCWVLYSSWSCCVCVYWREYKTAALFFFLYIDSTQYTKKSTTQGKNHPFAIRSVIVYMKKRYWLLSTGHRLASFSLCAWWRNMEI